MRILVAIDPGKYIGMVAVYENGSSLALKDQYEATSVEEALNFISQHSPDVIVMESFVTSGGRTKDFTALEVIAVIKFMLKKRPVKIVMQSPSCQANQRVDSLTSRHCTSAMKHVLYYLEKEKKNDRPEA